MELTIAEADYQELEQRGNLEQYVPAAVRIGRGARPGVAETLLELPQVGVRHKGSYSLHHCWDEFGGVRSYANECARLSLKLKATRQTIGA